MRPSQFVNEIELGLSTSRFERIGKGGCDDGDIHAADYKICSCFKMSLSLISPAFSEKLSLKD